MPNLAVPEFQAILVELAGRAGVGVDTLIRRASDRLTAQELAAFLTDAYPELLDPFLQASGLLTTQWYAEQPVAATRPGAAAFAPALAPLLSRERLAIAARWALTQRDPGSALRGSATRAVFDQSRNTVVLNAEREGIVGYARYARASACGFCRMLATRTDEASGLYRTEKTAVQVSSRRAKRKPGQKYHDHCYCLAVPVRSGGYEPPDYVQQWQADYEKAHAEYGSDPAAISRAMDTGRDMRAPRQPKAPENDGPVDLDKPAHGALFLFPEPR